VAVVDLGTNTCRLFLADVGDARVAPAMRLTTVVRLGQAVDVTRRLQPEAIARTRACLEEYGARLAEYQPQRRLLIATSVLRDAENGRGFLDGAARDFALPWRVLSGDEEAALSFRGGAAGLGPEFPAPLVLIDIGGGSTEFAVGHPGKAPDYARSIDIGAVRLTERFFRHDPPLPDEVEALRAFVAATLASELPEDIRAAVRAAVGVAGTFTTLVAHKLGLVVYQPALVHGHVLTLADIEAAVARFAALSSAERGRLPGIQRGREDVILAGAMIARETCVAFGLDEVRCSEADLLEGAALALAEGSLSPQG
jgi:exopolyphosphatase/guanosine-5'-triphosphate,3'-diphosphate pyrophosphatase